MLGLSIRNDIFHARPIPATRSVSEKISCLFILFGSFLFSMLICPPLLWSADLQTVHAGSITVLHHPGDGPLGKSIAMRADEIHRQIRHDLRLRGVVPVTVYLLRDDVFDKKRTSGLPPPWIAGTADSSRRHIVLRLFQGRSSIDYERVISHELTHVILSEDYPRHDTWPLWFREGLAMRQSRREGFRHGKALFYSSFRGGLLPLASLRDRFPPDEPSSRLAYAESYSVIAFLHSRYGSTLFMRFLENLRRRDFPTAFLETYGFELSEMEKEWSRYVKRRYSWIPLATGASTFWFLCVAVFFLSLIARRRKTLAIRQQWEEEDPYG